MMATVAVAQPGGPGGGPGGFPGGGRPGGGRPGGRPGGDWSQQAQQVKQKKRVKEGDTFKVVGALKDSVSGEMLAFVNVAVLDSADSSFVKGGSTNFDGLFEVQGIPAGSYLLRVSAIGYQNQLFALRVTNNTAMGTLLIKPGATTLREVTITEKKPLYAMDGEKMVYNVSEDPSIQTGTTEDALQNAPGVEVDVEGNITLRGVSSVEIWINDKPSKLTEENLKTYLQALPANALARIETITNPSAKYATSAEAVINIITTAHIKSNRFISFGLNGSNQPFISPWLSYMWAKEKLSLNIFASGRYSYRNNTNSSEAWRRTDGSLEGSFDTTLHQYDTSHSNNRSLNAHLFMNMNYEIDSSSEFSVNGSMFASRNSSLSWDSTEQFFFAPIDTLIYTTTDSSISPSIFGNFGLDYTKKFDNEGHNLRLGLDANLSNNYGDEWYSRNYTTYTSPVDNEERLMMTNSHSQRASLDARYNRPYSKDGEMSYGLRADINNNNDRYERYNDTIGTIIDSLRDYSYRATSASANADVNWTHRWGNFTLSTGLGAGIEHTNYEYNSLMSFSDTDSFTKHTLRPSIHLTYRTESMHNFKLNYSMRMSNPSTSQLSTFRRYGENSYSTGNPNLKATYTHSAEAGWQKYFETFGNIGIEAYGRLSTNDISSLVDAKIDEYLDRIVSFSVPYNMGRSWRYGTSLNMTYRPSGFLNVRLYANIYDYGYHFESPQYGVVDTNKVSYSVRLNAWTKVLDRYQIHLSANYTSPTISLMSSQKARYSLNMGVRADFMNRKLSVFVNVQDIFNWGARYGSGSQNTNPYYITNATNRMLNSRYISAGLTFRFGKLELERSAMDGSSAEGDSLN
ncbi:MAG: TonB-dependent receptor [Bacteroidales bacterium]|nr:TonB-dependent receptor [Bacteroidales bacterium]